MPWKYWYNIHTQNTYVSKAVRLGTLCDYYDTITSYTGRTNVTWRCSLLDYVYVWVFVCLEWGGRVLWGLRHAAWCVTEWKGSSTRHVSTTTTITTTTATTTTRLTTTFVMRYFQFSSIRFVSLLSRSFVLVVEYDNDDVMIWWWWWLCYIKEELWCTEIFPRFRRKKLLLILFFGKQSIIACFCKLYEYFFSSPNNCIFPRKYLFETIFIFQCIFSITNFLHTQNSILRWIQKFLHQEKQEKIFLNLPLARAQTSVSFQILLLLFKMNHFLWIISRFCLLLFFC